MHTLNAVDLRNRRHRMSKQTVTIELVIERNVKKHWSTYLAKLRAKQHSCFTGLLHLATSKQSCYAYCYSTELPNLLLIQLRHCLMRSVIFE